MQVNKQPREHRTIRDDGESLDVVNVWRTVQGEGPYAGTPATFVRTAGCNLVCPFCDTDYTSNRKKRTLTDLFAQVRSFDPLTFGPYQHDCNQLVVITGGEPLRQNLGPFTKGLLFRGYDVQLEVNGTLFQPDLPWDELSTVCSPKAAKVHKDLMYHVTALKYVLDADHVDPEDGLPLEVLGYPCRVARPWASVPADNVYVQPADVQDPFVNAQNMAAAVQSCMKFGYRLGIQLHKIAGLD